jgi:predicted PurR-regulated permease PerM
VPADLQKLAYDSALRALDKQEGLVEELRSRAGVVLAAASLAVSFLGRRGLAGPGPDALALLALLCFVVAVAAAVFVLLPKPSLSFSMSAAAAISHLFEFRDDPETLYRRAADILDRFWEENDLTVLQIDRAFVIAASALVLEVAALATLLGGTIL